MKNMKILAFSIFFLFNFNKVSALPKNLPAIAAISVGSLLLADGIYTYVFLPKSISNFRESKDAIPEIQNTVDGISETLNKIKDLDERNNRIDDKLLNEIKDFADGMHWHRQNINFYRNIARFMYLSPKSMIPLGLVMTGLGIYKLKK